MRHPFLENQEVYLFGSRLMNCENAKSDWDFICSESTAKTVCAMLHLAKIEWVNLFELEGAYANDKMHNTQNIKYKIEETIYNLIIYPDEDMKQAKDLVAYVTAIKPLLIGAQMRESKARRCEVIESYAQYIFP